MDALELLVDRRAELDRMFLRVASAPALARLAAALDGYLTVKEQILYTALPRAARHLAAAAKHTCRAQEAVLHALDGLDPDDPQLALRVAQLGARFDRLAATEEDTLFACVATHVDERRLAALGEIIVEVLARLEVLADLPLGARVGHDVEGAFLSPGA